MGEGGMSPEVANTTMPENSEINKPAVQFSSDIVIPQTSLDKLTSIIQKILPPDWKGLPYAKLILKLTPLLLFLTACGAQTDAQSVNEQVSKILTEGPQATEVNETENLPYGKAEFGNGVTAADALKSAIAQYQKVIDTNISDEEAQQIANNMYSETGDFSHCPACNVIVKDGNGIYMTNHWEGMYDYVNDGDPNTFVSDEINNRFSGSGEIYYFNNFLEAQDLMKNLRGQHLSTRFDEKGNDGQRATIMGEAAFAEPGVIVQQ